MTSPLALYGDGLRARTAAGHPLVRLIDGTSFALPLDRYLLPADATDERLLDGVRGPVLDVGCGPGRHLHALAARGVFALGVDLSPVAVELAIGGGGRAIVGDIFDGAPGSGTWRAALLLDGNIGIGGSPVRLLARVGTLLAPDGEVLVELDPPGALTYSTRARLERDQLLSGWFPWARVAVGAIGSIARRSGLATTDVWSLSDRWFARLRHPERERHSGVGRRPDHAHSVP